MASPPSNTARIAIALIGIALSGFSLYGFSTHEITLRQSTTRVHSEYRAGRPRETTFVGWQADVIRLGFTSVGILFMSLAYSSDRRAAKRNGLIAFATWLGISLICIASWTIGS